ncbi:hypothetical protein P9173_09245 [Bacillus safensis]|uniref:hypothetical protein n=1 Tax=Bacillus TaxID=1386 RepID=UPI00228104FD|nr:hypothetical protein [Bacillus safensis]MCY7542514.1 hypothetical protein [Bacillus safensis]MCY7552389.1 hypothetical protein [Bacillus safensis]MCY7644820.1 hypothetical protein [Bacillus safensis]MCY7655865.1 hypothetical protein [Bacillus safensis]MEC3710339.1 hypothetical protein [Bacillus safensis]
MLDSNIRGLFKRIEYQLANLKGLFSKNEKQMLENINEFKKDNEEFKDSQKFALSLHLEDVGNPHNVTKDQVGLSNVENIKQAPLDEFNVHVMDTDIHVSKEKQTVWDKKETVEGAQQKAKDVELRSKAELEEHSSNNDIHVNLEEKEKWNYVYNSINKAKTWQKPALLNGWKQYVPSDGSLQNLQFSKNILGEVEIIGSIFGGTIGFDVATFILPVEYRPLQTSHFIGVASSSGTPGIPQYHRTYIGTDGRVSVQYSSNTSNPSEFITFGFKFSTR